MLFLVLVCVCKICRCNYIIYSKTEPICPIEQGYCITLFGRDQNSGVKKLNGMYNGDTLDGQKECLKLCRSVQGVTGCEVIWDQGNRGCYAHTREVARGNGEARHKCWVFSKCKGMVF